MCKGSSCHLLYALCYQDVWFTKSVCIWNNTDYFKTRLPAKLKTGAAADSLSLGLYPKLSDRGQFLQWMSGDSHHLRLRELCGLRARQLLFQNPTPARDQLPACGNPRGQPEDVVPKHSRRTLQSRQPSPARCLLHQWPHGLHDSVGETLLLPTEHPQDVTRQLNRYHENLRLAALWL